MSTRWKQMHAHVWTLDGAHVDSPTCATIEGNLFGPPQYILSLQFERSPISAVIRFGDRLDRAMHFGEQLFDEILSVIVEDDPIDVEVVARTFPELGCNKYVRTDFAETQAPILGRAGESMDYKLRDAQKLHREHPDTFEVPPDDVLAGLDAGDLVKLAFEFEDSSERMWVRIESRDGKSMAGHLENEPVSEVTTLKNGDRVTFEERHVYDVTKGRRPRKGKKASGKRKVARKTKNDKHRAILNRFLRVGK